MQRLDRGVAWGNYWWQRWWMRAVGLYSMGKSRAGEGKWQRPWVKEGRGSRWRLQAGGDSTGDTMGAVGWCRGVGDDRRSMGAPKWLGGATDRWTWCPFQLSQRFSNSFKWPNSKFKIEIFPALKTHEKFWADRADQGNNFPFWSNFKIKIDFELQIQKGSRIWIWFEF
jgi:hypothetical protein